MIPTIQILVLLLAIVAAIAVLAARLKIPPAIHLVLTGVVLALIPGLPSMELAPERVLLVVRPALIYSSAVAMSWRDWWCRNPKGCRIARCRVPLRRRLKAGA